MNNELKIILCNDCQGKGIRSGTNSICETCKGMGATATDGQIEYYLGNDKNGKVIVASIKNNNSPKSSLNHAGDDIKTKRDNTHVFYKSFFLIVLIILYAVFFVYYELTKNLQNYFFVITVIFIGTFIIAILYDTPMLKWIVKRFEGFFIKDPQDFISDLEKRSGKI